MDFIAQLLAAGRVLSTLGETNMHASQYEAMGSP